MRFLGSTPATENGKPNEYSLIFEIKGDKIEAVQKEAQKNEAEKGASETVTPGNS